MYFDPQTSPFGTTTYFVRALAFCGVCTAILPGAGAVVAAAALVGVPAVDFLSEKIKGQPCLKRNLRLGMASVGVGLALCGYVVSGDTLDQISKTNEEAAIQSVLGGMKKARSCITGTNRSVTWGGQITAGVTAEIIKREENSMRVAVKYEDRAINGKRQSPMETGDLKQTVRGKDYDILLARNPDGSFKRDETGRFVYTKVLRELHF